MIDALLRDQIWMHLFHTVYAYGINEGVVIKCVNESLEDGWLGASQLDIDSKGRCPTYTLTCGNSSEKQDKSL